MALEGLAPQQSPGPRLHPRLAIAAFQQLLITFRIKSHLLGVAPASVPKLLPLQPLSSTTQLDWASSQVACHRAFACALLSVCHIHPCFPPSSPLPGSAGLGVLVYQSLPSLPSHPSGQVSMCPFPSGPYIVPVTYSASCTVTAGLPELLNFHGACVCGSCACPPTLESPTPRSAQ